jgi:hypothetical protein
LLAFGGIVCRQNLLGKGVTAKIVQAKRFGARDPGRAGDFAPKTGRAKALDRLGLMVRATGFPFRLQSFAYFEIPDGRKEPSI